MTLNDNKIKIIKIDNSRRIYSNEKVDIVIIEILDKDNLNNYNLLELDESIYTDIDFIEKFKNKNKIYHLSTTESGSSGAPILNLDTLKVIGIYKAYNNEGEYNEGIIPKESINTFNKENRIILTFNVFPFGLYEKKYFLQNN